jgi:SAM-dependent methyltransferase
MPGYRADLAGEYVAVEDDREVTVFPLLRETIRARGARTLLDYGGGDGRFARSCAGLGLLRVVTFDPSPEMNALAATSTTNALRAVQSTSDLEDGAFDVVTCNGVWMCWTTDADCVAALSEIRRLLAAGGVLLASVTHPCFRDRAFSTYRTDFDPGLYLADGTPFRVRVFDGQREVELEDTHWSLGAMTRQLAASGLSLTTITEVADRGGAPGAPWMIVEARVA